MYLKFDTWNWVLPTNLQEHIFCINQGIFTFYTYEGEQDCSSDNFP